MEVDKEKLFKEICNYYNYDLIVTDGRIIAKEKSICGEETSCFEYENYDKALKDWLSTLETTNEEDEESSIEPLWHKNEIEFISKL